MAYVSSRVTNNGRGKRLSGFEYSHQHSTVAGEVPDASSLGEGEIAINLADGLLYVKNSNGSVVQAGSRPNQVVSTGSVTNLTEEQQADIKTGTIVTTTDGRRWVYKGTGGKTSESSYIELADVTPVWSVIADKPSTFTPSAHTHAISDVTNLQTSLDGKQASGSYAAASHTHAASDITSGTIGVARLGSGTASSSNFLRGDGAWASPAPTVVALTYAATLNTNAAAGEIFDVTLTGNVTLSNPTNPVSGKTLRWRITQDGTGSRTVTLGNKFQIPSSATSPLPFSTAASKMDVLAATYHAGRDKWDVIAFVMGY